MKEILQTAICAVAAVIITGFICATVDSCNTPTKEEIVLKGIEVRRRLIMDSNFMDTKIRIERLCREIEVTDSLIMANQ